ncbi:uncharacterized protein LOC116296661 [Actinia tenebrosa]|uniref:Uncharacterized protein LOC116296661 n=1 Tax=Actinia tenebrosa TaxID=6105 RepID=A0A6P8I7A6_ACTTE|nr:uncharacterized protein LOC116296661 [Actinia tenebrosa]
MVDTSDLVHRLNETHWEKKSDYPNKDDIKEFRITRHMEKGGGNFIYLAQRTEEGCDDIFQLMISDTKNADPFKGVQIVSLAIKDDRKTIKAIVSVEGDYFVRKD